MASKIFFLVGLVLTAAGCQSAPKSTLVASADRRAPTAAWNPLETLAANSATCLSYSRTNVCLIRVDNYPQPIAVFIPPNFNPKAKQVGVLLHGWVSGANFDRNVSAIAQDFEIAQALENARSADLLILPSSRRKNQDYDAYFKNRAALERLVRQVLAKSGRTDTSSMSIYLFAHGGAHKTIGRVLKNYSEQETTSFEIERVALLDASYTGVDVEAFRTWLLAGVKELEVTYLPATSSENGAAELRSALDGAGSKRAKFFVGSSAVRLAPDPGLVGEPHPSRLLVRDHLPRLFSQWASRFR